MDTNPSPRLHLPADLAYSCHNSGVCCTTFPKIPVDAVCAQGLGRLDLAQTGGSGCVLRSPEDAMVREDGPDGAPILRRRPDGKCVFFGGDGLCGLHRVHGAAAKPRICRDFPFRFRETPDGVYVGLSFVCPSVRGNEGQKITDREEELALSMPDAFSRSSVEAPIALNHRVQLSWPQYLETEKSLHDLLGMPDVPLVQRLTACNILVNFVEAYVRRLHEGQIIVDRKLECSGPDLQAFLETVRRTNYAEVLRLASKHAPARLVQRMFLGMITSFGNTLFRRHNRFGAVASVLGQYVRHAAGLGGVRLNPIKARVSHARLARVRFPDGGPASELLTRYVRHCVFRKDLVYRCTLSRGLNLLLLNCALIRWYAAAVSQEGGRAEPSAGDFSEAIGHVEKLYGFHSRFYQFFAEHPIIDEVVESLMIRKNYPFLILA